MFDKSVYTRRREQLKKELQSGVALFLGNVDAAFNYPANQYHFRQDSNFSYFFGLDNPGFAGVVDVDNNNDYIFGNDVDIDDIIWMGKQPLVKDLAAQVGVEQSFPYSELAGWISKALKEGRKVHFLPPYRGETIIELSALLGIPNAEVKAAASVELIKTVVKLREIKDDLEIAEIEKALLTAYYMHTTAMKMAMPGMVEQDIAGTIEGISLAMTGPVSFPIILSVDGQTLHNHSHHNTLKEGRMMVTDAGSETALHYASDITRTVPVGGKFNTRQAEIYQIVLDANLNAIDAIKPGVPYRDIHFLAARTIVDGLKAAGLMKGDTEAAVQAGAHTLFMPHGLGHMMGLDVHDMEGLGEDYVGYDDTIRRSTEFGTAYLRLAKALKPGFVLTVEPGIYFIPDLIDKFRTEGKFLDFVNYDKLESYKDFGGIRIEDDVLVTDEGKRVLGKPIPKTIADVEKTMAEPREWLKREGFI
ncbi:aminopeptidase P family protein [Candidatus Sulfidibacterium hydrothermale]|uniref:aminopeptidase P family protein n=1 Tax=Candidatus Sulfidibacterium hydrothermale TaxID=2875962 RepID=UPI001F0A9884|nr:aminopeptidase P family protein [Candidatus Sulfidibacterium hydrothermale]UBM63467.1 aminopeptidase P family protein [Candidatus Sulfidibacterium hydrothermale]